MKNKRKHHQEIINDKRKKALKNVLNDNDEKNLLVSNDNETLKEDLSDNKEVVSFFF